MRGSWPQRPKSSPKPDLIIKVKEPQPVEYGRFKEGQALFTYLHLAADEGLTRFLMERKIRGIAYETVQRADGRLPLLAPMSEIAGRMAPQVGAAALPGSLGEPRSHPPGRACG